MNEMNGNNFTENLIKSVEQTDRKTTKKISCGFVNMPGLWSTMNAILFLGNYLNSVRNFMEVTVLCVL